jgi:hypothetical protein
MLTTFFLRTVVVLFGFWLAALAVRAQRDDVEVDET